MYIRFFATYKIRGKTLTPPLFFYQYSTYKGLGLKRLNIANDNLALFE